MPCQPGWRRLAAIAALKGVLAGALCGCSAGAHAAGALTLYALEWAPYRFRDAAPGAPLPQRRRQSL
ncbi:hypothetical protein PO883_23695 [Massilia sp. DJPM01]|uniref:hypothetical protein n=1 Tax=Massilia sp. DJPM01 TaxID=3024404 RepID=UPI00259E973B|nr:hypothetical protein [Massilia sp. DJPM01]MDM5180190.1 hypothetical protein [Massilia sp. DJPM01]